MGLCLLGYGVNLFIFSTGRLALDSEPVLIPGVPETLQNYTDPMPQALVLTAIVIGFAMTALANVEAMRSRGDNGSDHVDAEEPVSAERAAAAPGVGR